MEILVATVLESVAREVNMTMEKLTNTLLEVMLYAKKNNEELRFKKSVDDAMTSLASYNDFEASWR